MLTRSTVIRARLIAFSGSAAVISKYKAQQLTLCSGVASATSPSNITLYEYKICPYCNKVKAYLDFLKVDYKSVEVNPLTKSEIKFQKELTKVPVFVNNDVTLGESADIIARITKDISEGKLTVTNKPNIDFYPADTQEWSDWADKKLAVTVYPNITRSYQESLECLSYIDDVKEWNYPWRMTTKYSGAFFMSLASGRTKKKHNIVDERAELKECILTWTNALKGKKFLHGDNITMPDILVFGILRSIDITETFTTIMKENKELESWYGRIQLQIPQKQ